MVNKLQTQLTTTAGKALWNLTLQGKPVSVMELMTKMPSNTCRSTVARALRRMRAKGIVTSQRNGGRWVLWSVPASQPAKVQVSLPSSKGSSGRMTMCRPDNMPTLCAAIDNTVADLVMKKQSFSAHDVTKIIREETNLGNIDIDVSETGTVHVGGDDVPKIDHEIVKEVVHDLFHRGEMTGYDRVHNGPYWEYRLACGDDHDLNCGCDQCEADRDAKQDEDDAAGGALDGDDYDGSATL